MRPGRLARLVRFSAPSVGAVSLAVVAGGLVEGWIAGASFATSLVGAGAAALVVAPLLLAVSLAARGLWRAWQPALTDGGRAAGARLFGGAVHALLAAALLGAIAFAVAAASLAGGPAAELDPLLVSVVLGGSALALLAAGRPVALSVARVGARLGLRRARSAQRAVAALTVAVAAAIWFGAAAPALSKVDYGFAGYGWTAVVALVAAHLAARRIPRAAGAALAGAAFLVCAGLMADAVAARSREPEAVFDAWYRLPVGGLAIGALVDVDELRRETAPADLVPRARPGAPHPDVLVVTIDTVRADALRLYGGAAAMPALEALAARGRVFERAFAPSNNTRQSISSMMTGLSPARLRGRVVEFGLKLDPRHVVVAERFRAAGYDTAGFLCCPAHMGGAKKIGLDRGLAEVGYDRRGDRLAAMAASWLEQTADEPRPRFAWVHMFEPHDWERAGTGADPAARYRSMVEETDAYLAAILAEVAHSERDIIVVVASDHGEGLGERGALHHASNLSSSQIRVPLVMVGPGIAPGRSVGPVGLLDLAPTLLDLAGFEPPGMPAMDGRSFAGRVRGEDEGGGEAYSVMVKDRSVQRNGRALAVGRYHLIEVEGRRTELYDLDTDPAEARNLATRLRAVADELRRRLDLRRATDEEEPF